jgi:hypothetical protein
MAQLSRSLTRGALAGAAGTTALNAVTYCDMVVRGRPASSTPEQTVETVADKLGLTIPGGKNARRNRVAGSGPLFGLATGVGAGAALGVLSARWRPPLVLHATVAAALAMAAGNGPMTGLAVTDPRTWSTSDWLSDALPHAAYGLVTAIALRFME